MKYLHCSYGGKSTYFISERSIPMHDRAAEMHYIAGYHSEHHEITVETLGDVSAITVPYSMLSKMKELSRDEFISCAVPKILKEWRRLVAEKRQEEAYILERSYIQSRKLIMSLLNLDYSGFGAIL